MSRTSVRERVLLAALDLFSQKGYNSTSVDEIAEAANMKGPNLYKYFKNKDEIFLSLHVLMEENYRSNMSLDPEKYKVIRTSQDLKEFSLRQIRYTITNDNVRKLRKMCTIEQFRNDNLSAEASKHQFKNIREQYKTIFAGLMEAGVIEKTDPEMLAMEFFAPATLLIQQCDREPEKTEEIIADIERYTDFFIAQHFK